MFAPFGSYENRRVSRRASCTSTCAFLDGERPRRSLRSSPIRFPAVMFTGGCRLFSARATRLLQQPNVRIDIGAVAHSPLRLDGEIESVRSASLAQRRELGERAPGIGDTPELEPGVGPLGQVKRA